MTTKIKTVNNLHSITKKPLCNGCFQPLTKGDIKNEYVTCAKCIEKLSNSIIDDGDWKDDVYFS